MKFKEGLKLLGISSFIILFMIGWGIFLLLDYCFTTEETGMGIVVGRGHTAAWTQMMVVTSGKTTTIIPVYHPESWSLHIQIKDLVDSYSVDEFNYNHVPNGEKFNCTYSLGRISHSLYIKSIK